MCTPQPGNRAPARAIRTLVHPAGNCQDATPECSEKGLFCGLEAAWQEGLRQPWCRRRTFFFHVPRFTTSRAHHIAQALAARHEPKWSRNGASRLGLFLPHHVEDRFLPPINGPPPVSIADDVRGFRSHRPSGWLFFKFRDSHYIARPPCGSARLDLSPYL
jgi:hypothetical protein